MFIVISLNLQYIPPYEPRREKTGFFCICENKDADQLRGNREGLISVFVFATRIVQLLYFLNPKLQVSSHLLWLYSPVCVGPGRKPRNRFSDVAARIVSSVKKEKKNQNLKKKKCNLIFILRFVKIIIDKQTTRRLNI